MMKGVHALKENLRGLDKTPLQPQDKKGFEFKEPDKYASWDRNRFAMVLVGPSKRGKSNFAKLYAFENPCVCQRLDGLKKFNADKHDGLVFDDMNFKWHAAETQLHLAGVEDDAEINVKMTHVFIPAGTPRIFVRNYFPFSEPVRPELERRLHVVDVDFDLRVIADDDKVADIKPPDDLQQVLNKYREEDDEGQQVASIFL